jgi:predicted aldo/keto reductase-like oxidoreductase
MEQVVENVKAAGRSGAGKLTKDDLKLVDRVAGKYREVGFIKCTGCRYCAPCPSGVAIPEIFSLVNEFFQKDRDPAVKARYVAQLKQEQWANNCTSCGRCEELCPQHLPIRNLLREAHQRVEVD